MQQLFDRLLTIANLPTRKAYILCLLIAVSGLVGVVVFMYRKNNTCSAEKEAIIYRYTQAIDSMQHDYIRKLERKTELLEGLEQKADEKLNSK